MGRQQLVRNKNGACRNTRLGAVGGTGRLSCLRRPCRGPNFWKVWQTCFEHRPWTYFYL